MMIAQHEIEIFANKLDNEELDDDDDKERDREIWTDWEADFTDAKDNCESGTMGRKCPSPEYIDLNDGIEQLANNNNIIMLLLIIVGIPYYYLLSCYPNKLVPGPF
jgi:hypothetical protein